MSNAPPSMAAPQIPNLLSLRGGARSRGTARGRGRGRGQAPHAPLLDADSVRESHDKLIQGTDKDASFARLSAVHQGYFEDPFAAEFTIDHGPKRFPLINRGTYVRTKAIDRLVRQFMSSNSHCHVQIISLGAGTDTRYFRLRAASQHTRLLYHEIDFPNMSEQKLAVIRSSHVLSPEGSGFYSLHTVELTPRTKGWGYFSNVEHNRGYVFHPLDLRTLHSNPQQELEGIRWDMPTLLISECCLCYLEPMVADAVLDYFSSRLKHIGIALYEPTNPSSNFGKTMMSNLASRGLEMPSVLAYPNLDAQIQRLMERGFGTGQNGATVLWLWNNWVDTDEKERLARIESLDEVEEWELLASHYLVIWAWIEGDEGTGHEGPFSEWDYGVTGERDAGRGDGKNTPRDSAE